MVQHTYHCNLNDMKNLIKLAILTFLFFSCKGKPIPMQKPKTSTTAPFIGKGQSFIEQKSIIGTGQSFYFGQKTIFKKP